MDPGTVPVIDETGHDSADHDSRDLGSSGAGSSTRPDAYVLYEHGQIEERIVHDAGRVEARREERELEALAQRYAAFAASTEHPPTFEQFVSVIRSSRE